MARGEHLERVALFDRLYEAHHKAVHAYLLGRTNHAQSALDLLQETFLRVWRHIDKAKKMDEEQRRYWLFRIAKSVAIGYYRKRGRRQEAAQEVWQEYQSHMRSDPDPEEQVALRETVAEVDKALGKLPEELRLPLIMQVMGEMTSTEIAEVLDRPAGTIRYQIHKARKELERLLQVEHAVVEAEG